ncbi:hypothetical protein OGAPHI_001501 [Ogataea philodendri]|uniref:Uncharacterized protein n=1 Tax=Ogataea philodendri TaxID=1378263 RepID=A0A9P8T8M8_9ASCO|nr:uncharacterized protein OGAPHI_001501 [Ogataea philodendri]KAH3669380.1 hypothetical protein OGAPHI_001501 [Ogataea philodendri]
MLVVRPFELGEPVHETLVLVLDVFGLELEPVPLVAAQQLLQIDNQQIVVAEVLVLHHRHPIPERVHQLVQAGDVEHHADVLLDFRELPFGQLGDLARLRVDLGYLHELAIVDLDPDQRP